MSFIDDFIHRVKTGRLFAGWEKQQDTARQGMNVETLEEISRQFMVLETRLKALKEEMKSENADVASEMEVLEDNTPVPLKKQVGPDIIIHFLFMDRKYVVESFNLNFRQDMDTLRNRPNSFTCGGTIQITVSGFIDSALNEWIDRAYPAQGAEIRFFPNIPKITDSSLLTISLSDAYCIASKKEIDTALSGILTTLTISSRTVKIGNEEFENRWKRKEPLSHTIKSV